MGQSATLNAILFPVTTTSLTVCNVVNLAVQLRFQTPLVKTDVTLQSVTTIWETALTLPHVTKVATAT